MAPDPGPGLGRYPRHTHASHLGQLHLMGTPFATASYLYGAHRLLPHLIIKARSQPEIHLQPKAQPYLKLYATHWAASQGYSVK